MRSFDWKKNVGDSIKDRNIIRTKDDKRKTTKGIFGCHDYHETCWWNSG